MKIKIISSKSPINWYAAHIGGEFEVINHETDKKKFVVVNNSTSLRRLIYKDDCVVLNTESRKIGKPLDRNIGNAM